MKKPDLPRRQSLHADANLDSAYTYNNEGKITGMTYPSTVNGAGTSIAGAGYNYSYDTMYRLAGMTDTSSNTIVNGVSYDAANRLLGMTFNGAGETRSYNTLGQLVHLTASGENLTYNYPTGTNNGKAGSMYNAVSGETVTYTYDSLNRLATAAGQIGSTVQWAETYGFDGFGNLLSKTLTAGTGPTLSQAVNPGNNQIVGQTYDANGNLSYHAQTAYDVENRVYTLYNGPPYTIYSYDAQGKRVFLWAGTLDSNNNPTGYSLVAYSPSGQKLGTYLIYPDQTYQGHGPFTTVMLTSSDKYFGGRRLAVMDQLGSAGTYYPWGEAKGTTNPQDAWSYATYWRDSATGLDYANQRYYANSYGRFMTPDPYGASGGPSDPGSWNRYTYTRGDPVNRYDPSGLADKEGCNRSSDGGGESCDNDPFCPAWMENCEGGDPGGGCYGGEGFAPSPGPYCEEQGGEPPPQRPERILPIWCEPDVIAAMKKSWQQSTNGMSGKEAGFSVNGSPTPGAYSILATGAYSSDQRCKANISYQPGETFALFHVHPNGCDPWPSGQDTRVAKAGGFDIYTFSSSGLWEYNQQTGISTHLRSGMDWTKPCPDSLLQ